MGHRLHTLTDTHVDAKTPHKNTLLSHHDRRHSIFTCSILHFEWKTWFSLEIDLFLPKKYWNRRLGIRPVETLEFAFVKAGPHWARFAMRFRVPLYELVLWPHRRRYRRRENRARCGQALPLVHTERVAVQHSTKNGKLSIICTVLHRAAASACCVNTLLRNNCFHYLHYVTQMLHCP